MLIQTLYFFLSFFFFLLNFILKVCNNWNKIHVFSKSVESYQCMFCKSLRSHLVGTHAETPGAFSSDDNNKCCFRDGWMLVLASDISNEIFYSFPAKIQSARTIAHKYLLAGCGRKWRKTQGCRTQTCTQINNKQSGNQDVDVCRHGKVKLWASCEHSDLSRRDETGLSCPGLRSKIMWVNNRQKFVFRKLSVQFWILG